jgi:acyl dehydratase
MAIAWNDLQEGTELPALEKQPSLSQLVKYAAGSGDFNPLHYDRDFFQARQIGSVIVHGRFKYAVLGELISRWLGHRGRIKTIACQFRGMDFPDQPLVAKGVVTRKWEENGERLVQVEVWTENAEGKRTTPGEAVVVLDA